MEIFILVALFVAGTAFLLIPTLVLAMRNGWYGVGWAAFACLFMAAIGGYVYDHTPEPDHFTLRTSDWECHSTYQEQHFNGKIWYTITQCAQYSRRGYMK